jgi:hypothetical protein
MQPLHRPWEGGLAWAGIVGGFVAGLIPGIVALISYFHWQEKRIPKPTAAWVIGSLVLALVGVVMVRAVVLCPTPASWGLAAGITGGLALVVFTGGPWRKLGTGILVVGFVLGANTTAGC